MQTNVKERLMRYLSFKGVSKAEFGRRIGVSPAYVTSIRRSIQPDKLERISKEFSDLNLEWLVTGQGDMILKNEETVKTKYWKLQSFFKTKGISLEQISADFGNIPIVSVERMLQGDFNAETAIKFMKLYGISPMWLMFGKGDMTNDAPMKQVGIPLVSQYAYAGYTAGFSQESYIDALPRLAFTPDREMTGNWVAFEVKGDSMDDGTKDCYSNGDIVICREVEKELYQHNKLHFNRRDFVIVLDDGVLIKKVIAHDVDKGTITLHSLNPEYKNIVVSMSHVMQIFSIIEQRKQR